MFFFYIKNLFLNIISNITPIYREKYTFFLKEVLNFLNNINIIKYLSISSLFYKILPKIFPQLFIGVVSTLIK